MSKRGSSLATLSLEAIAASTPYVLVDLSDTTNFPHSETDWINLFRIRVHGEKATDGRYDIWFGVVTELDATNGTAEWIHCLHLEADGNPTDGTDRFAQEIDFGGINLEVDEVNEVLPNVLCSASQDGHTNWDNNANLTSPAGATTSPGVGDLVMWIEETVGGGTIDLFVAVEYNTE